MIQFDPSQQRVLAFEPTAHARVLGAAGSGKTALLAEAYAAALDRPGWVETDVLALAASRAAAASLRNAVETRLARPIGGTPVRTPTSLAFAVLAQAAAAVGDSAPRLLTGTVQDEAITSVIERRLELGAGSDALAPEVMRSPVFRAELREFWRVLDDFDLDPAELIAQLDGLRGKAAGSAMTDVPDEGRLDLWRSALTVIAEVSARLSSERPVEKSSSALLRAACRELSAGRAKAPRLILVDDAQELGEGQLALLAACAHGGSRIWVFGDPDTATATFYGERSRILMDLGGEFSRRGVPTEPEQLAVLDTVHRHGGRTRELIAGLTARIGAAGAGAQRAATAASDEASEREDAVSFVISGSPSEQIGVIAHRMRSRHLGLDGETPLAWRSMAVVCRSRSEAARAARGLALHQVPTGVAAGGMVLREHRLVRDLIRLLQHSLGIVRLDAAGVLQLLGGPIGGLDPVAVRRLRGALMLQERRAARDEDREVRETDELVSDAFDDPAGEAVIDTRGGRALRRLGRIAAAGDGDHAASGTPRETLWALWSATGFADEWQAEALEGRGHRSDEAHRSLDAVMGLFFALQRHEEQASEQRIEQLLDELLESSVPEDSLAQRAERDAVTVTTPQGALGAEFALVAVVGAQDGAWPNTRARGSLLGTAALERWLRGGEATDPSRRDTIHDELRLFAQACSRASGELLVVAIGDEENHPSPFFAFGAAHLRTGLPSTRLTLRGATAAFRRRLVERPDDAGALASLAELARAGAAGAHPDEWYGVLPPSTDAPLYPRDEEGRRVPVSPSQMERAENCPLNWVVGALGGSADSVEMNLGTLVHHAFETAQGHEVEALVDEINREWRKLRFEAEWESERAQRTAATMAAGLAAYLREFDGSDRELVGRETGFSVPLGRAELRGTADRLESRAGANGTEVSVLDLKTGANAPTGPETQRHAQLQAYQLGVLEGGFSDSDVPEHAESGGARLLYVHPGATRGNPFVERAQAPLDDDDRAVFVQRVVAVAEVMSANEFSARVEHHCSDPYGAGSRECRIHVIRAVSHS